uniref:Aldo_ket_red domain-containing protein n=1 Tax=Mesocestoides corti TaxID=53468 RepID=A0A5K3EW69_MESCO
MANCWDAVDQWFHQSEFTQIGLANCSRQQLYYVLSQTKTQINYLQIEMSVYYPNAAILALSRKATHITIAVNLFGLFSPTLDPACIMPIEEKIVKKIASQYQKSPGQILVKHALQLGLCPLIKSNCITRIRAYAEVSINELTQFKSILQVEGSVPGHILLVSI